MLTLIILTYLNIKIVAIYDYNKNGADWIG